MVSVSTVQSNRERQIAKASYACGATGILAGLVAQNRLLKNVKINKASGGKELVHEVFHDSFKNIREQGFTKATSEVRKDFLKSGAMKLGVIAGVALAINCIAGLILRKVNKEKETPELTYVSNLQKASDLEKAKQLEAMKTSLEMQDIINTSVQRQSVYDAEIVQQQAQIAQAQAQAQVLVAQSSLDQAKLKAQDAANKIAMARISKTPVTSQSTITTTATVPLEGVANAPENVMKITV